MVRKGEALRIMEAYTLQLVNAGTLARNIGVSEKTIRKWTSQGRIPFHRLSGKCTRYDLAEIVEWLEERRVKASA